MLTTGIRNFSIFNRPQLFFFPSLPCTGAGDQERSMEIDSRSEGKGQAGEEWEREW